MNPLLDDLPVAVEVAGVEYPINSGFRACLTCILAWEDPELTAWEKTEVMLSLLYPTIPENIQEAAAMATYFLNCGKGDTGEDAAATNDGRLFSFAHDAQYIYAAIKQQYGVDLNSEPDLHWWKFCFMFADLPEDCFFNKMINLRRGWQRGTLTKEERAAYVALRSILELPTTLTPEEQEAENEFMRIWNGESE